MRESAGNGANRTNGNDGYEPGSIIVRSVADHHDVIGIIEQVERQSGRLKVFIVAVTHGDDLFRTGQIEHWSAGIGLRRIADAAKAIEAYTRLGAVLGRKLAALKNQHHRDPANVRAGSFRPVYAYRD